MRGFLFDVEPPKKSRGGNKTTVQPKPKTAKTTKVKKNSQVEINPCEVCGLYKEGCKSPFMHYTGEGKLEALVIAEAPGEEEDKLNTQLIGDSGSYFRLQLRLLSLDLDKHFWKINAVNCRPPKNRKPKLKELKQCWNFRVLPVIQKLKPKFVILLGEVACSTYFRGLTNKKPISTWRGWIIPDFRFNCWVMPVFHPSYLIRNRHDKALQNAYLRDLRRIRDFIQTNPDRPKPLDFDRRIRIVTDFEEVVEVLKKASQKKYLAFDYECSGFKPYHPDHRIWSIAFAWNSKIAYAIPYQYIGHFTEEQIKTIKHLWSSILRNPKIKKIAHNLKFEDKWSARFFGPVEGWYWDTMTNCHIIDNRGKISSLKFQAFVRYGVIGYEADTKKFMVAPPGSVRNNLDKLELSKLLRYNGIDALLTFKLFEDQRLILESDKDSRSKAKEFFHEGLLALSEAEKWGWYTDLNYYKSKKEELTKQLREIEQELVYGPAGQKFYERYGKYPDINSNKDLPLLLFNVLGLTPLKKTMAGADSTDKEVVHEYASQGVDYCQKLLEYRRLTKIAGTYIHQFEVEVEVDSRIHPVYNLHIARTYRSSCSDPNMQNLPVRDDFAKQIVRGGILPTPGNKIVEVDYSSLEVHISCLYNKDPNLIKYVTDPTTDMHRDSAADIWMLEPERVSKKIRFYAKNGWVFPQFYGDWYQSCARGLWENCLDLETEDGIPIREHLKTCWVSMKDKSGQVVKKQMTDYDVFVEHCRQVEDKFWNERFKVYNQWRKDIYQFYVENGYIETYFGFRFTAPMGRKECTNYPIQGTAFHCLLWSFIELNKALKKYNFKSKLMGQIHDSILIDLYPPEQDKVLRLTEYTMTKKIRKVHDWIIIPLKVEFEITEVDQPWSTKKEFSLE